MYNKLANKVYIDYLEYNFIICYAQLRLSDYYCEVQYRLPCHGSKGQMEYYFTEFW